MFRKVNCQIVGADGNAFAIVGRVHRALIAGGFKKEAAEFMTRATQGDYSHLLDVVGDYVNDIQPFDEDEDEFFDDSEE